MGKTEKTERKSRKYSDQHTQNQKMKIWDEGNIKKVYQFITKQVNNAVSISGSHCAIRSALQVSLVVI